MIKTSKERYLQFRERAREIYTYASVIESDGHNKSVVISQLTVPLHANVQICEGGAFVEAIVWVPNERLEKFTLLVEVNGQTLAEAVVPQPRDLEKAADIDTLGAVEEHSEIVRAIMGDDGES